METLEQVQKCASMGNVSIQFSSIITVVNYVAYLRDMQIQLVVFFALENAIAKLLTRTWNVRPLSEAAHVYKWRTSFVHTDVLLQFIWTTSIVLR